MIWIRARPIVFGPNPEEENSGEINDVLEKAEILVVVQFLKSTMKCQRFLSIPIFAVLLLMGFVCYITVFIFIDDWVGLQSSAGSLNALILTILASLCLFSFSSCVLIDPGYAPASYIPDVEDSGISDQEPMKDVSFFQKHMWSLGLSFDSSALCSAFG